MRLLAVLFAATLVGGCNTEKQTVLAGCEDVDDLTADQPVNTFLTLNSGLQCEFSGSCAYGQTQIICGEPSDLKQVRCVCMSGTFQCYDLEEEIASRRAACGE